MATENMEQGNGEFFTELGMLIIQGRKWDSFRRFRSRGLHCPAIKNTISVQHQCSVSNLECQTALSFRHTIQSLWQRQSALAIDVTVLPECGHQESSLLLEKWTIHCTNGSSKMPKLSLMQAIDSTIHFSQLSSWWASTNGCWPKHIQYRVHEDNPSKETSFLELPVNHLFPASQGCQVKLKYLPRQKKIPELQCTLCSPMPMQHVDAMPVGSPVRGRAYARRRGSRNSSASSDSLSPSVSKVDISPYGSPLLASHLRSTLSSSSSSRGSSRTSSPCISRSSSERNMLLTFGANRQIQEQDEDSNSTVISSRTESTFLDQAMGEDIILEPDSGELTVDTLECLSDSDLSDDFVIDGPVGSPGLVGSTVASPDDIRVQMLQNTYSGWHARRPTFDRLMNGSISSGNRTRHSSLDSAVTNFERLDLRSQRRLSRTGSDEHELSKDRSERGELKGTDKEFFIRDIKKRHKMYNLELDGGQRRNSTSDNTFYASFLYDSESLWKTTDNVEPPMFNPMQCLEDEPHKQSAAMELFSCDENYDEPSTANNCLPLSMSCMPPQDVVESFQKSPGSGVFYCDQTEMDTAHNGTDTSNYNMIDATPICKIYDDSTPRCLLLNGNSNDEGQTTRSTKCNKVVIGFSNDKTDTHNRPITPILVVHGSDFNYDTSSEHKEECRTNTAREIKQENGNSSKDFKEVPLLRSPPSKLRILPRHCVSKNFDQNPPRDAVHKIANSTQCKPARRLRFNQPSEKVICTSPAPIRRNNSVRFEFDEDMPKLNQRSSRSMCRGKCMKKNGTVMNNCARATPKHRLLGSFEESIIHDRLEVLGTVEGFHAQLGASGTFCPAKVKLPVDVKFFHISDDNAPSPYMGTMVLGRRICGKRGYHIPRKGTIQLTLFNPNESVVKVFVILYDVNDMPPGHRTFLRHRIYSKPVVPPVDHNNNSNLLQPEPDTVMQETRTSSKCLRYFVNLWLESSKTNKIYIHGDIKILFSLASNEWDSGSTFELHSETEFPKNPKYSSKR